MSKAVGEWLYGLDDCLGSGGFGSVFLGRHKSNDGRQVAIKVMRKVPAATVGRTGAGSKKQEMMEKEIAILKSLTQHRHQNIVPLLDVKVTSNNLYLVMEFCRLGDLSDYLAHAGKLPEPTISLFLRQISTGMAVLKENNIVHRDLKPQNILLTSRNKECSARFPEAVDMTVKIADFGLARILDGGSMASTMCGTPAYSAPEVLMQAGCDTRADLWSVGVITYESLTSERLYNSVMQHMRYRRQQEFSFPIPDETSPGLTDLMQRLLRFDPNERIAFDDFYHHTFIRPPAPKPAPDASVCESVDDSISATDDLIDETVALLQQLRLNLQHMCSVLNKFKKNHVLNQSNPDNRPA